MMGEILCAVVLLTFSHFFPHVNEGDEDGTGILVPLYVDPDSTWYKLIEEKHEHHNVPIIAVINPSNGPGTAINQRYAGGVRQLQHSGIIVLGYVYTNYGIRNATDIESEINSYKDWYGVNGIFFDEMANVEGKESYYANLTKYVKTHDMSMTIGNPGTDTLPSYVGTVDNLVLYENQNLPPVSLFGGWHENFTKNNFSFVSYGVESMNSQDVLLLAKHVGYLYVTERGLDNPWDALSGYFDKLVEMLKMSEISSHHRSDISNYQDSEKIKNATILSS